MMHEQAARCRAGEAYGRKPARQLTVSDRAGATCGKQQND